MGTKRKRFPYKFVCREDVHIEIRPLRTKDIPVFRKLHESLFPEDRALLREDVLDPYYDRRVRRQIEDNFIFRLVAWHGDAIVASVALHRKRPRWLQHTADIRAVCNPEYRRFGITTTLFEQAIPFAAEMGIEKLYVNLMPEQRAAIGLVKHIGFTREATLKDHVKDGYGIYHDLRIYSIDLEAANKAMENLLADMMIYSG